MHRRRAIQMESAGTNSRLFGHQRAPLRGSMPREHQIAKVPGMRGANISDFRKAGLERQVLNFGALNACVPICRFVQLYECHRAFVL